MQGLSEPYPRNLGLRKLLPAFLVGFLAAVFQVYLLREFAVHFYGNEMTYGLVLGGWLLWGGLGSIIASRRRIPASWFGPLLLAVIAAFPVCLAVLRLSRFALHLLPGEITGLVFMLPFALGLTLIVNFPLGMLFVLAVRIDEGNLGPVWVGESLGAALGGLVVSLLLVPHLTNGQGAALVGGCAAAAWIAFPAGRRRILGAALVLPLLVAAWVFDLPSQKLYWKPFELLSSRDTPYGRLQVIKLQETISLYSNGLRVFTTGDKAEAEESVHFALLQDPGAKRALLVGGGAGGCLTEALKYPLACIDHVELDPEIVRMSLGFLPPEDRAASDDERVRTLFEDGRAFLRANRGTYDVIILSLPEPANAQINRFYTREFFALARDRLAPKGILSFRLPSSENYLSYERWRFLATIYRTLKSVFPRVKVIPGETNIFLASRAELTTDAETLSSRVESLGLDTVYVRREFLMDRLDPLRTGQLNELLGSRDVDLNTDLAPVSYFFDSLLWNSQFRSVETRILSTLAGVPRAWLLGVPLGLIALALLLVSGRRPGFILAPLLFLGFTQIVAEIMVLLWFETLYGSVYGRLALLLASFMAGLSAGSFLSLRLAWFRRVSPRLIQLGILVWLAAFVFLVGTVPPQAFFYIFLLVLGFLGGQQFIAANRLFLQKSSDYGLGYGLDLLGSFFGALAAASVFIPLAGLRGLAVFLAALNGLALAAMVIKRRA